MGLFLTSAWRELQEACSPQLSHRSAHPAGTEGRILLSFSWSHSELQAQMQPVVGPCAGWAPMLERAWPLPCHSHCAVFLPHCHVAHRVLHSSRFCLPSFCFAFLCHVASCFWWAKTISCFLSNPSSNSWNWNSINNSNSHSVVLSCLFPSPPHPLHLPSPSTSNALALLHSCELQLPRLSEYQKVLLYCKGDWAMGQAAQRCCCVSFHGDKKSYGHNPG